MKASEARALAESKNNLAFREQFDNIMRDITHNAKFGYFEIKFYETLREDVESQLKKLGYEIIKHPDGRNGVDVKIQW